MSPRRGRGEWGAKEKTGGFKTNADSLGNYVLDPPQTVGASRPGGGSVSEPAPTAESLLSIELVTRHPKRSRGRDKRWGLGSGATTRSSVFDP